MVCICYVSNHCNAGVFSSYIEHGHLFDVLRYKKVNDDDITTRPLRQSSLGQSRGTKKAKAHSVVVHTLFSS